MPRRRYESWRYFWQRALLSVGSLVVATFGTFIALRWAPGDPLTLLAGGRSLDPALVTAWRLRYGYDQSIVVQYLLYIRNILQGDFGLSYYYDGRPVSELLIPALITTIQWQIPALVIAILSALILGVFTASTHKRRRNSTIEIIFLLGVSLPEFAVAALLISIFSLQLQLLPVAGVSTPKHFILPAATMVIYLSAALSQILRTEMVEVIQQDYVRTARAKGLSRFRVLTVHALPNAILPFLTVVATWIGRAIGGAFLIETIFNIPGVGRLAVQAVMHRDYPVVLAVTTVMSLGFVLSSLMADLLASALNPRAALTSR